MPKEHLRGLQSCSIAIITDEIEGSFLESLECAQVYCILNADEHLISVAQMEKMQARMLGRQNVMP